MAVRRQPEDERTNDVRWIGARIDQRRPVLRSVRDPNITEWSFTPQISLAEGMDFDALVRHQEDVPEWLEPDRTKRDDE